MPIIKNKQVSESGDDQRFQSRDFAGLVAELDDERAVARRWAARDLAAYPEACAALLSRLGKEDDASVREVLMTSLTRIGTVEAVRGLINCLRSDDAALRNAAIESICELPDAAAIVMDELLTDGDPDVRLFAVNILATLPHPQAESWLIDLLGHESHVNVCAAVVDALLEIGTVACRSALTALLDRFPDEPYIRFAIDLALKRIGQG